MNKSLHLEQKNIFENENVFKVYNSVFALFKFTQCMRKLFFSSIRIGVCKIFRIPTQLHKFGSATLIFFKQPSFCWNFPIPLFECFDVSKGFFLTPKVQNLEVSALGVYVLYYRMFSKARWCVLGWNLTTGKPFLIRGQEWRPEEQGCYLFSTA